MKEGRQLFLSLLMLVCVYVFFLSPFSAFVKLIFAIIYVITIFCICFMLMLENRSPYKTLLWIYVLIFFPVIGYIFYIFSGQLEVKGFLFYGKKQKDEEFIKRQLKDYQSSKQKDLPEKINDVFSFVQNETSFPVSFHSSTFILKNGSEKFPAVKEQLMKAASYIHLEYYTLRSDEIGMEIIEILMKKAKDGLDVRVLFDAAGSLSLSKEAIKGMEEAGVQVACFSPIKYGFFNQKINFRNHRKIIVIDGTVGFVGGLNIGDEYLGRVKKFGFWRDTHVLVKGEALHALHGIFMMDWAYVTNTECPDILKYEKAKVQSDGGVQVVATGPGMNQGLMGDIYFNMIVSAKKSVWIATPYFVPDKAIRTALTIAGRKGIDVRLMVPEISDGFLTQYGTRSYFGELLRNNVKIYHYQKGFMHQKIVIVDGEFASIGTANMDLRSLHLNFEVNLFLYHASSIKDLIRYYQDDMAESERIDYEEYKNRHWSLRVKESFARLFSPVL